MPLNRLGNYLSQTVWNQNVEAVERLTGSVGGRGVLQGLVLSHEDGLELQISSGRLVDGSLTVDLAAREVTAPASANVLVWIDAAGAVVFADSSADLTGGTVCLGSVSTSEEEIVSVTADGRTEGARWVSLRSFHVGRAVAFADEVSSFSSALEVEQSATFGSVVSLEHLAVRPRGSLPTPVSGAANFSFFGGELWGEGAPWTYALRPVAYGEAVKTRVLSGDLVLTEADAPVQVLDPSGGDWTVTLPVARWGRRWTIVHAGSSGSLEVGSLATLASEEMVEVGPTIGAGGVAAWPLSVTPVGV